MITTNPKNHSFAQSNLRQDSESSATIDADAAIIELTAKDLEAVVGGVLSSDGLSPIIWRSSSSQRRISWFF